LLVALYRRHGPRAPQLIAGPFAWLLWDPARGQLLGARDRLGNHGFYYTLDGGRLLAANRLEALLGALPCTPSVNPRAAVAQINGLAPPEGETFYEGIRSLPPGSLLTVGRDTVKVERYWRPERRPLLRLSNDADYAEAFKALLFQVVADYLPPGRLGITLSSGLDSTSVAAAVRAVAPRHDAVAICWTAPELPEADESRYSLAVAARLGLPAIEVRADRLWPLCTARGMRTGRASPFRNYYTELWDETLGAARREGIATLFTGVSGDHLFGGNVFAYPDLFLTGRWLALVRQLRQHLPRSAFSLTGLLRRMLLGPIRAAYWPSRRLAAPVPWLAEAYRPLYDECLQAPIPERHLLPGRQQRLAALRDPLLPQIAELSNLQAAEHGIELRHPLLDHRLFEFAASLPTDQTFRAAWRKVIVRNAMRGVLPDEVLDRFDKIYPTAIADRGLREREQAKVWPLLTRMRAAELGFVDEGRLRDAYRAYLDGKEGALFWHTLTLEDWLRRYF
jgi:asparagine synthase (glutamine-hydrolysing)